MAKKSFLDRMSPAKAKTKALLWPFPCEGERPTVTVKVLGAHESEAAYLAACDHFRDRKPKIDTQDPVFLARESIEIVWRAYSADQEPLAPTADGLAEEPSHVITELYKNWAHFQSEAAAAPMSAKEMDELVNLLKKNIQEAPLDALPSSWLIALCRTLASPDPILTPQSGPG